MRTDIQILLVEDDDDVRHIMTVLLRRQGYQVHIADDGVEALRLLEGGLTPSLILLDLMMPKLDGEGLIAKLREDTRFARFPIVILSGHDSAHRKAKELGVVDCIVKPVDLAELVNVINRNLPPPPETEASV